MKNSHYIFDDDYGQHDLKLQQQVINYLEQFSALKKILIIPPDITRKHSQAGIITNIIYQHLYQKVKIDILPALGTHHPMSQSEIQDMFGSEIPLSCFIEHKWEKDTVKIGEISNEVLKEISEGYLDEKLEISINKIILQGNYDQIISVGQVLPHEVVGMSNYTKNIAIGCGGKEIINKSHYLGAVIGLESLIGKDCSPVRKLLDYIEEKMLINLPLSYILTVNEANINPVNGLSNLKGIFSGRGREIFNQAVALSQKVNINYVDKQVDKFVVYLNPAEFVSLWLSNKAIYRTRTAIADNGELIVVAPGLKRVGENNYFDYLIQKYGYAGQEKIIEFVKLNQELQENLAVPAHLIHGSTEGRFKVTYVSDLISENIIKKVNYNYMSLQQFNRNMDLAKLNSGWNLIQGNSIYYISDPATGLWVYKNRS